MKKTLGVIVGRFQVSTLHPGHIHLISESLKQFDETLIIIGVTKNCEITKKSPLPYQAVVHSITESFPEIPVVKMIDHIRIIEDIGNWDLWIPKLDEVIENWCIDNNLNPQELDINICGSRDSVPTLYKQHNGKYNTYLIGEVGNNISGTNSRKSIADAFIPNWTKENRELIIWFVENYLKN